MACAIITYVPVSSIITSSHSETRSMWSKGRVMSVLYHELCYVPVSIILAIVKFDPKTCIINNQHQEPFALSVNLFEAPQ